MSSCMAMEAQLAQPGVATATQVPAAQLATPMAPAMFPGTANPASQAAEAILDWMETHGGQVRLTGHGSNLPELADALRWSQAFLPTCGRLVAFLRQHGQFSDEAPDVLQGMALS